MKAVTGGSSQRISSTGSQLASSTNTTRDPIQRKAVREDLRFFLLAGIDQDCSAEQ
jgi:hypothetical protein